MSSSLRMSTGPQLKCIIIGAGNRGFGFSQYALDFPSRLQVVAVADPKITALERIKNAHNIPPSGIFKDWKDIPAKDKFADFVIVTTPDQYHKEPVVHFANKGYHILVEKPMAITEEDCIEIANVCKRNEVMLCVGHVLRYFPPMKKIKELIEEGRIGNVVNIQHLEPVGFWHFAHSYVRGNWRNEAESTFSLLAKCCHDIDLIMWWMGDKRCEKISSFGSLIHFTKDNKIAPIPTSPEATTGLSMASGGVVIGAITGLLNSVPAGAGTRCMDCKVEQTCPYSAKRLYIGHIKKGNKAWPVSVICNAEEPTLERVTKALETGPYGRCVYECDNDVNDNQVVNMQFTGGATATMTMIAYTDRICRRMVRIFGTKGEITLDKDGNLLIFDFLSGKQEEVDVVKEPPRNTRLRKHSGADYFLFSAFIEAITTNNPSLILNGPDDSLASHLLVFAAERSRRENRIVDTATELPSW